MLATYLRIRGEDLEAEGINIQTLYPYVIGLVFSSLIYIIIHVKSCEHMKKCDRLPSLIFPPTLLNYLLSVDIELDSTGAGSLKSGYRRYANTKYYIHTPHPFTLLSITTLHPLISPLTHSFL